MDAGRPGQADRLARAREHFNDGAGLFAEAIEERGIAPAPVADPIDPALEQRFDRLMIAVQGVRAAVDALQTRTDAKIDSAPLKKANTRMHLLWMQYRFPFLLVPLHDVRTGALVPLQGVQKAYRLGMYPRDLNAARRLTPAQVDALLPALGVVLRGGTPAARRKALLAAMGLIV